MLKRARFWVVFALVIACFTISSAQSSADRELAADIDTFVQKIITAGGIPAGLAVAVVKEDRPVLVKGYGYSDLEQRIRVTENTVFYIASTTKAFTALTLALMAERKKVDLDLPITRYLKDAEWGAGVDPDSITLRQLLSHTHGIEGDGPVVWRTAFTGVHTNGLLKKLLRHHGASEAGKSFSYTNVGYNIAGLIIDEVTGGKWQDELEKNIFAPLGMKSTSAYISRFDSTRLAMPYIMDPAGPRRAHYAKRDGNMQAAGGLVSTAADLAKWLEAQINQGRLDGKQVFPQAVMAETQRLQVEAAGKRGELPTVGYTLGWTVGLQGSDTVLLHGGGFSTFRTEIAFDPKNRTGVAVMTNEAAVAGGAIQVIMEYALEGARNAESAREKYAARLPELPKIIERVKGRIAEDRARRGARPQNLSKPLEAYAGSYENEQGGVMTWSVREGRLWAEIGALKSIAEVYDHEKDLLRVELEPGMGRVVQFNFENGRAAGIVFDRLEYARK